MVQPPKGRARWASQNLVRLLKGSQPWLFFITILTFFVAYNERSLLFPFSKNFVLWMVMGADGGLGGFLHQKLRRVLAGAGDSGGKCRLLGPLREF
jgi:hypothetical protein